MLLFIYIETKSKEVCTENEETPQRASPRKNQYIAWITIQFNPNSNSYK